MSAIYILRKRSIHNLFYGRDKDHKADRKETSLPTSPVDGASSLSPSGPSQGRTRGRFRRTSSRFIAIFGIRRASSTSSRNISPVAAQNPFCVETSVETSQVLRTPESDGPRCSGAGHPPDITVTSPPMETCSPHSPSHPCYVRMEAVDGPSERRSAPVLATRSRFKGLRRSKSSSSLPQLLTKKLSSFMNQDTVRQRPQLKSRPSILAGGIIRAGPAQMNLPEELTIQSLASPSTTSSLSPLNHSTAPTSLFSETGLPRPDDSLIRTIFREEGSEGSVTHLEEIRTIVLPSPEPEFRIEPSVTALETTAAAKTFFEIYFNDILSGKPGSRSHRRKQLEAYLSSCGLPSEECQRQRLRWFQAESEHLRETRVLNTKFLHHSKVRGLSVAGFEVVRVLGKGSFGVVRLVREKAESLATELSGAQAIELPAGHSDGANEASFLHTFSSGTKQANTQVYAMKVIRKSDMLRNCQEGHLRAERDFLVLSESSRWVVPLIASFQDSHNLYLVMEYMVGGDFLGLLLREDVLDEAVARWYIAEMILCVEETHKMNWIHRDIKPDNFLITSSGHLKISDFGLAFDGHWAHNQVYYHNQRYSLFEKFGIRIKGDCQDEEEDMEKAKSRNLAFAVHPCAVPPRQQKIVEEHRSKQRVLDWLNRTQNRRLARSVVGTSQYMAPEVINGADYDGRCDYWSIGIILYECLYGCTPFFGENRATTKERILRHKAALRFPEEPRYIRPARDRVRLPPVSQEAIHLLRRLLTDKDYRISSSLYRANDIRLSRRGLRYRAGQHANFVFPNDCEEIKAHHFFRDIDWNIIHLTRPPFIPLVRKNQPITKYFDDEKDILSTSDHLDESSRSASATPTDERPEVQVDELVDISYRGFEAAREVKGEAASPEEEWDGHLCASEDDAPFRKPTKKKEPKRARDKILRDPQFGKEVLKVRKDGAFMGYTYRRPRFLVTGQEAGFPPLYSMSILPRQSVLPLSE